MNILGITSKYYLRDLRYKFEKSVLKDLHNVMGLNQGDIVGKKGDNYYEKLLENSNFKIFISSFRLKFSILIQNFSIKNF